MRKKETGKRSLGGQVADFGNVHMDNTPAARAAKMARAIQDPSKIGTDTFREIGKKEKELDEQCGSYVCFRGERIPTHRVSPRFLKSF